MFAIPKNHETMRAKLFIISFFLLVPIIITAQSMQEDVRLMLVEADQANSRGHYQEAYDITMRAKNLIGRSDEHIQHSLIKALFGLRNWYEAQVQIRVYYSFNPARNHYEYREVQQLEKLISQKILLEEQDYSDAKNYPSISICEKYIKTYPNGKYIKEVEAIYYQVKNDEEKWQQVLREGNSLAYQSYINSYPNGLHAEEARLTVTEWDNKAYNVAVNEGTQSALNLYLQNYPQGQYYIEISNKLVERKDYDAYQKAKSSNNIGDYELYIAQYPKGKYEKEVHQVIKNSYFSFGETAFNKKQWVDAEKYYNTYIEKYPYGEKTEELRRKVEKCKRMRAQTGMSFIGVHYQKEYPIGLTFGKLNVDGLGFYGVLKTNIQIVKLLSSPYSIDANGISTSPNSVYFQNEFATSNWSVSLGTTYKILYPLWIYGGVGVNKSALYQKVDEHDEFGNYKNTVWMKHSDIQSYKLYPEFGIMFKPGNTIMMRYGIMRWNNINLHEFGLGFALGSESSGANERRETRKSKQKSGGYFAYSYDKLNPIGLSIGSLKTKGLGFYMSGRINTGLFKVGSALWDIDDAGNTDSPWDIYRTGETMNSNWAASMGSTRKLIYPIWIYGGLGVGQTTQYDRVEEYDTFGDLYETVWMKNTDHNELIIYPEYGGIVRIKSLVLKYGIMRINSANTHQISVGFAF